MAAMRVLGIETSCDENSVAVVEDGRKLLSNVIFSQVDLHKIYGGVVPEVAARSHIEVMTPTIDAALEQAFPHVRSSGAIERKEEMSRGAKRTKVRRASNGISDTAITASTGGVSGSADKQASAARWAEIDAIAVSYGPGLGGSLLIGTLAARTLALIKNKPLYGVHHALGHIYANFIDYSDDKHSWSQPQFPLLALVVSGGHSHLVLMRSHADYKLLGQTQDDAAGEAFDKVAKVLGLEYPGGPAIEKAAKEGDPQAFKLPKAGMSGYDYSFSGLKTAVLRALQDLIGVPYDFESFKLAERLKPQQVKDMAASFQYVAAETLVDTALKAYEQFQPKTVVIAGGVAANQELRRQLRQRLPINIDYAPISLCTDNGAMIAALGYYAAQNRQPDSPLNLDINPSLPLVRQ